MRKAIVGIALALLLGGATVVYAKQHKCPIDDSSMRWVGKTKFMNARMFYLYKCLRNHQYWIRSDQR